MNVHVYMCACERLSHNDPTYVINHSFEIFLPAMRDIKMMVTKFLKPRVSLKVVRHHVLMFVT